MLQSILEALDSLTTNKMRSALTILGIVIGVGAVIAMLAIGRGAQDSITADQQHWHQPVFVIPGERASATQAPDAGDANASRSAQRAGRHAPRRCCLRWPPSPSKARPPVPRWRQ
jgi:hypothetical protein